MLGLDDPVLALVLDDALSIRLLSDRKAARAAADSGPEIDYDDGDYT